MERGVLFGLLAYALWAFADALIKQLGKSIGVFEVGLVLTTISLTTSVFLKPREERLRDALRLHHPWLMQAIAGLKVIMGVSLIYAFMTLPLAEAYALGFLIPATSTILSVVFLKEDVPIQRWLFIGLSFAGVLIVVRPGFNQLQWGHLAMAICVLAHASASTLTRLVSGKERKISLFIVPPAYTVAFNLIMVTFLGFQVPNWTELSLMIACGVISGVGSVLFINAVAMAPISRVEPMNYSQIVWALLLGAVFFGEFPDVIAIIGMVIVVLGGLGSIFADRLRIWTEARKTGASA
jgi:drug/metabolite transporter (DMT)-like permease